MRVLIYGSSSDVSLGKMCLRGFENIGHHTRYHNKKGTNFPLLKKIFRPDSDQRELIKSVDEYQPELILVIKGYNLGPETISSMQSMSKATIMNWNPDNPFQIRSTSTQAETYLSALPEYDVVLTWGRFLINRLEEFGAPRVEYLPFGWDPIVHGSAKKLPEYECDVAFLGTWSKKREKILIDISDFDLQVRGNSWRTRCHDWSLRKCYCGPSLGADNYANAIASAKVVINILGEHNKPDHNMRSFEVPSTGTVMATTRTQGQKRFFSENEDIIMFDTTEELRQSISNVLTDDNKRKAIERNAKEAVSGHRYLDRMRKVIEYI